MSRSAAAGITLCPTGAGWNGGPQCEVAGTVPAAPNRLRSSRPLPYESLTDRLLLAYPFGFFLKPNPCTRPRPWDSADGERASGVRMLHVSIDRLLFALPFGLAVVFMLWVLWNLHLQLNGPARKHAADLDRVEVRAEPVAFREVIETRMRTRN